MCENEYRDMMRRNVGEEDAELKEKQFILLKHSTVECITIWTLSQLGFDRAIIVFVGLVFNR